MFRHQLELVGAMNRADLVLLDTDPLVDIRNTRRINVVVAAGVLLPHQRLNTMRSAS